MTSSFERHGIDHLSASAINLWINSPSLFVLERLLKFRGQMGASAHRGTATEVGVSIGLFDHGLSVEECVAAALPTYEKLTALSGDPKRDDERKAIPGMVRQGLEALRERGTPIVPNEPGRFADAPPQHRITLELAEISVPIIGYLDWLYDIFTGPDGLETPAVVDLKSTLRVPSDLSETHARQATIYKMFHRERRVFFAYVSDKRSSILPLIRERYDQGVREIIGASQRLERFLGVSDDPHELAALVPHSSESFYFNDPLTKAEAVKVFGY